MNSAIEFYNHNYCTRCDSYSIELYDRNFKSVNYNLLISRFKSGGDVESILNNKSLSFFKCNKCGVKFNIDWTDNNFPKPLREEYKIQIFLSKHTKKKKRF